MPTESYKPVFLGASFTFLITLLINYSELTNPFTKFDMTRPVLLLVASGLIAVYAGVQIIKTRR